MDAVRVKTSLAAYEVVIGAGILPGSSARIIEALGTRDVVIITDEHVGALYAASLAENLAREGARARVLSVPAGERSKSWIQAGDVLERMVGMGLDRRSGAVVLGGGVVGDLGGFCAAIYMRGIPFVQIPTTLLAQVDSSVGGKTAVDLKAGKNLVGAFAPPRLVVADTSLLASLPPDEWRSGLAEVAKSGILDSEELMSWMEGHVRALAARDPKTVEHAVNSCVTFKARIVESDEHERGARESLNYGHTLGHAIETTAGYGAYSHGAAVAEGIRFAARIAERLLGAPHAFTRRQEQLLDAMGLPALTGRFDAAAIRATMGADKKARAGRPRFVLVPEPGEFVVTEVDDEILAEELAAWTSRGREVGQ